MDTKKIEVLLRAIELGSLSKAAHEYLYTPSAVSHILDSVESEIGTRIIKRTYKGIEAEESARDIIFELEKLIETEKRIVKMASAAKKGKETINIATYSSISKYILPRIIKGFKKMYQHIDINIIVVDRLKEIYDNNNADILFGERYEDARSVWEELINDPYVAVLPSSYKCTDKIIKRETLYKTPFIMAADTSITNYMDESKMEDIIRINSHDDSSVFEMVREGMGTAILPSLSVEEGKDVILRELDPKINRILGIVYRTDDFKHNEHIRSFVKYIREFIKTRNQRFNSQD